MGWDWGYVESSVAHPQVEPLVPRSSLAGYVGTPLSKKLGVKVGSVVALMGAPDGFEETLGELPESVELRRHMPGESNLIIWFARSREEMEDHVDEMARSLADKGGLWIACPKKASSMATDLTQNVVREVGLAAGLVDHKVCAIDGTWSGLLFARRKSK